MKLTEAQKNSLQSALFTLEESLDEIDAFCVAGGKEGIFYCEMDDLDDRETGKIRKGIADIKVIIGQLSGQIGAERKLLSKRRMVIGRLSLLWEMLCSLDSKSLRSYGDVDESLRTELDPKTGELIRLTESLIAGLKKT